MDAEARKKEHARLEREAQEARCLVCEKPVGIEDRCQDGNYLHRACASATSVKTRLRI